MYPGPFFTTKKIQKQKNLETKKFRKNYFLGLSVLGLGVYMGGRVLIVRYHVGRLYIRPKRPYLSYIKKRLFAGY